MSSPLPRRWIRGSEHDGLIRNPGNRREPGTEEDGFGPKERTGESATVVAHCRRRSSDLPWLEGSDCSQTGRGDSSSRAATPNPQLGRHLQGLEGQEAQESDLVSTGCAAHADTNSSAGRSEPLPWDKRHVRRDIRGPRGDGRDSPIERGRGRSGSAAGVGIRWLLGFRLEGLRAFESATTVALSSLQRRRLTRARSRPANSSRSVSVASASPRTTSSSARSSITR